jgi:type VI secretion system protein ImpL
MTVGGAYGLYQLIYYINTLRNNRNMLADLAGQTVDSAGGMGGGWNGDQGRPATATRAAARASRTTKRRIRPPHPRKSPPSSKVWMKRCLSSRKRELGGKTGRTQYLYQLPWYIIIGPPGSGKTTALINSGLRFPLGAGKVRGVGGTRNCDWWFTDEAVLLDTAGRYTTQDSHEEVDRAAWRGFLDLLKKHRRRRPINGAFVAISLSDLMQQNEEERTAQASPSSSAFRNCMSILAFASQSTCCSPRPT